jgi:GDP-4-dehydro-6-deoxy-D-mannose reductase
VKAFVTGASGFIGSHLVDYLLARGDTVTAFGRRPPMQPVTFIPGDILDVESLGKAIKSSVPDVVFHLAGQSLTGVSWIDPVGTFHANVDGTLNILHAIKDNCPNATTVLASSSSIYAQPSDGRPLCEDHMLEPATPYGVSKVAADQLARLFAVKWNLRIIVARPFFWIGPRKSGDVTSDWCRRVVALERGKSGEMIVGNLDIVRDFIDVRDGVEALAILAQRGESANAYNIGSGVGTSLHDVLTSLSEASQTPLKWRVDPALIRPVDEPKRIADVSKISVLGWLPRRIVKTALLDTLDFWRNTR